MEGYLMGVLKGHSNAQLQPAVALKAIESLGPFIEKEGPFHLGYFLGVAFDTVHSDYDRRRFKHALLHMLKKEGATKTLLVCIDPNFTQANIARLMLILRKDQRNDSQTFLDFKDKPLPEQLIRVKDWAPQDLKTANEKLYTAISNIAFLKLTLEEKEVYVLFLNVGLTSAYSPSIGSHLQNQLNIQRGTKTISNYTKSCVYEPTSFYGLLEALAKKDQVSSLSIVSAATSHSQGAFTANNGHYAVTRIIREFGKNGAYRLDNRYFEDFCEILTLMKNVSDAGKPVVYINLEKNFPVFKHSSVTHKNTPYEVPFKSNTEFYRNTLFAKLPDGGSRRRRQKKKAKKAKATRRRRT